MDKDNKDNANPTIRDVSQLPSRRGNQAPVRRGPESKYDDLIFGKKHSSSLGSFRRNVSSWPSDDEDDEDDYVDGFTEEPIDSQEIYGMHPRTRNVPEPGIALFALSRNIMQPISLCSLLFLTSTMCGSNH